MQGVAVIWWMLVLIVLIIAAFIVVVRIKRWASKDEEAGENFTLSDLRRLHKNGQMSAEEFEKARALIVVQSQQAQQSKEKPGPDRKPAGDLFIPPPSK